MTTCFLGNFKNPGNKLVRMNVHDHDGTLFDIVGKEVMNNFRGRRRIGGMDKGSRGRRIGIELKFIAFFNNSKNPFIISHLFPVVDEEAESGSVGDVIVSLGRKNLWGSCCSFSCTWAFGFGRCGKVFDWRTFQSLCSETPAGCSYERGWKIVLA